MEFVNMVGALIITAAIVGIFGYGIRHRGRIANWLNNYDHGGNKPEKETEVTRLKRRIEDAESELAKLEQ